MGSAPAIETSGLTKRFGAITAVDQLDLSVETGEIYSLLGPNGAGKSTTISIISCLIRPDAGTASVFGNSVESNQLDVKRSIGVVPQEVAVYPDLSAQENLVFWGRMYGMDEADIKRRTAEVLDLIGLSGRRKEKVEKFSGGMKRRLNIGVALLHEPELVIMDEPTVGIDPQSRRHILDSVKSLNERGTTVLYTTHYMEEAQELSDHIGIIDKGKLIANGTHEELVHIVGERDRITFRIDTIREEVLEEWRNIENVERVTKCENDVEVLASDGDKVLSDLVHDAVRLGLHISSIDVREPNLEAVFLHLTGRGLRD